MADDTTTTDASTETTETDVKDWKVEAEKFKALARKSEERAKGNAAAAKELDEVKGRLQQLAPLQKLAEALGAKPDDNGKTDFEALTARLGQHEQELAKERLARFRVEVASEKGLSPAQAKRLNGATREELAADADEILQLFPVAAGSGTAGPQAGGLRPDRSQGNRGGQAMSGRDAGLAEAQKRFGTKSTAT
jgi:hypothetical protein